MKRNNTNTVENQRRLSNFFPKNRRLIKKTLKKKLIHNIKLISKESTYNNNLFFTLWDKKNKKNQRRKSAKRRKKRKKQMIQSIFQLRLESQKVMLESGKIRKNITI